MKMNPHIAVILVALIATSASFAGAQSPRRETTEIRGNVSKRALEKGMSAEEIVRLVGKPETVRTMAGSDNRAEIWTYRRVAARKTQQVVTGTRMLPGFDGRMSSAGDTTTLGSAVEPVYGLETVTTYQVTALLLFDGKLVTARQSQEQTHSYD